MQSYAPRQLPTVFGQQEAAVRWSIVARKPCKLFFKILKAEIDAERLRVLQEKFSCLGDLRRRLRLYKCKP
jgi:hypothetical protein